MANLNIGASLNTVNTLAGLPVDKGTIYATLSSPSNLSLAADLYQGQKLNIVINPTANMILPMPTATGWYSTFGETLALMKDVRASIDIFCIGSKQYLIAGSNAGSKGNGYDYVDLGLPSSLLWATCNVGASQPHEYGKYFQWGATEGYYSGTTEAANHSSWATCPWSSATPTMTQLDAAHDAARANMGGEWRMPTSADTKELVDYTTSGWTTVSGVNGVRFTSKSNSSNSIFIPAAGLYVSGSFYNAGSNGYVWSSSLNTSNPVGAYYMGFGSSYVGPQDDSGRYLGFSVRGVLG